MEGSSEGCTTGDRGGRLVSKQRHRIARLARVTPHVLRLCPALLSFMSATNRITTEAAGQTATTKTKPRTEKVQYQVAVECCNHAISPQQPDPINKYKAQGYDSEL